MGSSRNPDWIELVAAAEPQPFLQAVQHQLQSPQMHFKSVQQSLASVLFRELDPGRSLEFLLSCLEVLVLGAADTGANNHPTATVVTTTTKAAAASASAAVSATVLEDRSPVAAAANAGAAVAVVQESNGQTIAATEAAAVVEGATTTDPSSQPSLHQQSQHRQQQQKDTWSGTLSHLLLELIQQQNQQQQQPAKRLQQQQQEQDSDQQASAAAALVALLPQYRTRVLRLFAACCAQPRHARIALKVAQAFGLTSADVADPPALAAAVSELLSDRVTVTPGLGLVMHFQGLLDGLVDRPALLARLVAEGKEAAAEKWAASLSREDKIVYVEICIAADRLKAAARATRLFGLKAEFPDIEARYRRAALSKLASKRVWGVAATFVGSDPAMQMELLLQMVEAGEAGLADEYRKRFGLPPSALNLDPEQLAAQEAARSERYLPLALPPSAVLFVDGPVGLRAAARALAGASVVGIDVEWRASPGPEAGEWGPDGEEEGLEGEEDVYGGGVDDEGELDESGADGGNSGGPAAGWPQRGNGARRRRGKAATAGGGGGGPNRASLLQVATRDAAVLFDLPALCAGGLAAAGAETGALSLDTADPDSDPILDIDSVLLPLFAPGGALVLGFGLAGDLAKLASSYPHVAAFRRVGATLDLYDMWKAYVTAQAQAGRPKNAPPVSLSARAFQAGLSTLAATLLGKPLDKTMQVSDWEARPLSPRQLTYAAQDAHVLVRLWDVFQERLPGDLAERVAAERTVSFTAGAAAATAAAGQRAAAREATETPVEAALPPVRRSQRQSGPRSGNGDGDDGRGGGGGGGGVAQGGGADGLTATDGGGVDAGSKGSDGELGAGMFRGGMGGSMRGAVAPPTTAAAAAAATTTVTTSTSTAAKAAAGDMTASVQASGAAVSSAAGPPYKGQIKALTKTYGKAIVSAQPTAAGLVDSTALYGSTGDGAGSGHQGVSGFAGGGSGTIATLPSTVAAALERHGLRDAVRWISNPSAGAPGRSQGLAAVSSSAGEGVAGATLPSLPRPQPQQLQAAPSQRDARGVGNIDPARAPASTASPAAAAAGAATTAFTVATATAADAASTLAVPLCRVAKSIAVLAAGKPWLAVVRGDRRLDWHKARAGSGPGQDPWVSGDKERAPGGDIWREEFVGGDPEWNSQWRAGVRRQPQPPAAAAAATAAVAQAAARHGTLFAAAVLRPTPGLAAAAAAGAAQRARLRGAAAGAASGGYGSRRVLSGSPGPQRRLVRPAVAVAVVQPTAAVVAAAAAAVRLLPR